MRGRSAAAVSSLSPTQDHYRTLGVTAGSSIDELRRAYRELARELHPDRHLQSDPQQAAKAAERMVDVNAAWAVLSNPGARELYDLELRLAGGGARGGMGGTGSGGGLPSSTHADQSTNAGSAHGVRYSPLREDHGHPVIRGLLWFLVLGVLAAIFVLTAYAANSVDPPSIPSTTTGVPMLLGAGDCVDQVPGAVNVVPCSAAHDATIERLVPLGRPCPAGTREVYLPDQQESACLTGA